MSRAPERSNRARAWPAASRSAAASPSAGRGGSLSATRWTLVQAAQAGDAGAIRDLCQKYRPAVVAYLERRGLGAEAEDVAQEALLGLVGSALARANAGSGSFRGLVFAVTRNQLLKHLERRGAQKRGAGRVASLGEIDPAAPAEPDPAFDREWLGNLVRSALARLAQEQPKAFAALQRFALDGVPQAEIGRELGLTSEQVKKLVFRAKRRVATFLREEVWSYAGSSRDYETELALLSGLLGEAQDEGAGRRGGPGREEPGASGGAAEPRRS